MLSRLEQRLGVALFDRRGKRLALNAYGRIFYEHARRAQLELDSARRAIDDLTNPAVSEIRLGFLSSFGSRVVPHLIAGFTAASPRVAFTLQEGAAESIGDLVESELRRHRGGFAAAEEANIGLAQHVPSAARCRRPSRPPPRERCGGVHDRSQQ